MERLERCNTFFQNEMLIKDGWFGVYDEKVAYYSRDFFFFFLVFHYPLLSLFNFLCAVFSFLVYCFPFFSMGRLLAVNSLFLCVIFLFVRLQCRPSNPFMQSA